MDDAHEALVDEITRALEVDHQHTVTLPAWETERIDAVRKAGRAAARRLGWKVRTLAVDLDDGSTNVHVVVTESTPEDEARAADRRLLLMREAIERLPGLDLGDD